MAKKLNSESAEPLMLSQQMHYEILDDGFQPRLIPTGWTTVYLQKSEGDTDE